MGNLCRDRTIILVTHHVALCLPTASYLVEISQGKVLYQGTIQDLRAQGILQKVIEQENEDFPKALPDQEPEKSVEERAKAKLESVKSDGKLIDDEFRAAGRISMQTYWTYIRAAGLHCFFLTVLLLLLGDLSGIATQVSSIFMLLETF
jgi:ABC-type multidrug transport system ATPase subunit